MQLINYKNNIYSENGEDGILEKIFDLLSSVTSDNKWCVEFGAWDGKYASNTFNLIKSGWNGVYIEGDVKRFEDLINTSSEYPKIIPICAFVSYEKESKNNLDNLLSSTLIPDDFDLLSIDIDSFDLDVWNTFNGKPKVVCIEINSSVMPGIMQWHDGNNFIGNSFASTLACAKDKGYTLVCHTGNMIFVRNDLMYLLNIEEIDLKYPERLFKSDWVSKSSSETLTFKFAKLILPTSIKNIVKKLFLMRIKN